MSSDDTRAEAKTRGREPLLSKDTSTSAASSQDPPTLSGSTPRNGSLDRVAETYPANEQSPLLSASGSEDGEDDGLVDDQTMLDEQDEYQITKSVWYLILLTISIGGLQIAWAVELSNGSPYLLSLGLSKSLMALVWIAGPLSGSLVQPYVGIRSDNCRISWGKRKPFMIAGTIATIVSLLALAWTREIVGGFFSLFGADSTSNGVKNCIIVFAVIFVYILDFAINTGTLLSAMHYPSKSDFVQYRLESVLLWLIVLQLTNKVG
jgi:solute carrier family 45 protein 1/2/4